MKVTNAVELEKALRAGETSIELTNSIGMPSSIHLQKGQKLVASGDNVLLSFINGGGISLAGDNEISGLAIQTNTKDRAIWIDAVEENLGTIRLNNLLVTGMVQLLMRAPSKTLEVAAENVDVIAADARSYSERPMKYGVNVYQGAFTVYNYNPEEGSHIQITAKNISVGRKLAPVFGSGIFLSGFNDESGLVEIAELTTGDVYSNGMIPTGQPNLITGGIFIVYGAYAKSIVSNGLVETYGTNDMVLDVWGKVDKWVTKEKVVSYGPSGIGFVNFGSVGFFQAEQAVETYGLGARGFNQYDGTITEAIFHDIVTEGDGSIGMQFSMPVGKIVLENGVTTKGSVGQTLVKGEIKTLHADAISVLKGGEIKELVVQGNLVTEGNDVVGYHVNGGQVHKLSLDGELITKGQESKAIVIENDGQTPTQALQQYL